MRKLQILILALFCISACQTKTNEANTNDQEAKQNVSDVTGNKPKNTDIKGCTKDSKLCENGIAVARDPENNCKFASCDSSKIKKTPVMCSADVKECPDGSFVSRNHDNNCRFKDCPNSEK
ncbi:MAG: hypothetical protein AB8B80_04760 [Marinicellaceae bacterium]